MFLRSQKRHRQERPNYTLSLSESVSTVGPDTCSWKAAFLLSVLLLTTTVKLLLRFVFNPTQCTVTVKIFDDHDAHAPLVHEERRDGERQILSPRCDP